MIEQTIEWNNRFEKSDPVEVLRFFHQEFGDKLCLSSSMGAEDQVLTDMLVAIDPHIRIFTLDTGRLFPETLNLIDQTTKHYKIRLEIFFPDYAEVQKMVREKGINLFYDSVENRKMCCQIRKLEPLGRALNGMKVWITGIRKDQTLNRFNTRAVEWDETYRLIKINPLYRWSEKKVWNYIHQNHVPFNELHLKSFPSIGCQPCTKSVKEGEDPRAGRWWWEADGHKECGLHIKPFEQA